MLYLPISLFIFIVFHPQCFYSVLLLIFIVFPPPPPPPPLYYFPSSMFLFPPRPPPLLIYIILPPPPPPPPPHFYCFPSKRPKRLKSGHHVRVWPFTPDFNLFGLFEGKQ